MAVRLVETNDAPGGCPLVNRRKTNKASSPMDLVELATSIQQADESVKATASSKLTMIVDQIRYLQEQARQVLKEAQRDNMVHHAACNMVKKPGTMYYMYERESGQKYMSILSPTEWGSSCPHEFIGAYRLEYDKSWTPIEEVEDRTEQFRLIDKLLTTNQKSITDSSGVAVLGDPKEKS